MLNWTFLFLLIALIAGLLGFGSVADAAVMIAKICFVIFLAFFVAGLIVRRGNRRM